MGKARHKIENSSAPPTFIHYNALNREERLFFAHCGLDRIIGVAARILEKRLGPVEIHKLDRPYFSDAGLAFLNQFIMELLIMIGEYSNGRFGAKATCQDSYFRRPSERNTFPTHLFVSRWQHGANELIRKEPGNKEKIEKSAEIPGLLFSKKLFKGIGGASKLTYGLSKLGEIETRAVGVLYMIDLSWLTLQESRKLLKGKERKKISLPEILQAGFALSSLLDESDQMISRSRGGKVGDKRRDFGEALAIIEGVVKRDPELDTVHLANRAKAQIEAGCDTSEQPGMQRIRREIVKIKKSL